MLSKYKVKNGKGMVYKLGNGKDMVNKRGYGESSRSTERKHKEKSSSYSL